MCVCVCEGIVCVGVVRYDGLTLCSQGNSMTSTAVSLQMRQLGADSRQG